MEEERLVTVKTYIEDRIKKTEYTVFKPFNNDDGRKMWQKYGRKYFSKGLYMLLELRKTEISSSGKVEVNGLIYTLNSDALTEIADYRAKRNKQKDEYLTNHGLLEQKV